MPTDRYIHLLIDAQASIELALNELASENIPPSSWIVVGAHSALHFLRQALRRAAIAREVDEYIDRSSDSQEAPSTPFNG